MLLFQPEVDADTPRAVTNIDPGNFLRSGDDSFSQRKSDREILEIGRRDHHHGIGRTIEFNRSRDFIGDFTAHRSRFAALRYACNHLPMRRLDICLRLDVERRLRHRISLPA
jgi:hypothetical protein